MVALTTRPKTSKAISARITILLLGCDQRNPSQHNLCTDAMMVLSVCPAQNTAVMLSLPRDIYTQISETGAKGRINTVYQLGENVAPSEGGALAISTIEALLHLHIDYYLLLDFEAFYKVIDAIGPITVSPNQAIYDDRFPDHSYGYMTVRFPAGQQVLNAVQLLQYARVRHHAGYDFGRTQRQQEIIRAVRKKVLRPQGLLRLAQKFPSLWRSISSSIDTNMTLPQMLQIAEYALQVPRQNIYSAVPTVQRGQLRNFETPSGEQVLIPVDDKLWELVQLLFEADPTTVIAHTADRASPQGPLGALQRLVMMIAGRITVRFWFLLMRGILVLQQVSIRVRHTWSGNSDSAAAK